MTKLQAGDTAPEFTLTDQNGKSVALSDFKGKKILLYFYPKAMTPGCTTQACSIRDAKDELLGKGVVGIGISPDPYERLKRFEEKQGLNFTLLSDSDHKIAEAYGTWDKKSLYGKIVTGIVRSSFLIGEDGKIIDTWYKVRAKDTVLKAQEML